MNVKKMRVRSFMDDAPISEETKNVARILGLPEPKREPKTYGPRAETLTQAKTDGAAAYHTDAVCPYTSDWEEDEFEFYCAWVEGWKAEQNKWGTT